MSGSRCPREVVGQLSKAHWVFQCPYVSYVRWAQGIEAYLSLYVVLHQVTEELVMWNYFFFWGGGGPFNNDGQSSDTSVYDGKLAYAGLIGLMR